MPNGSSGLNKPLRGINSFHSHISGDNHLNSSLDPVISEEDAQLENDVPIVQLVDFENLFDEGKS